jgi:phage FluMu protein Com
MNPIFSVVVNTMLSLKRTCPKCKRDQIVPASKRKQIVRCKFCNADVPPRKQFIL